MYRPADQRLCFRICKKQFSHNEARVITAMKFSTIALLVLVSIVGLCQAQFGGYGYGYPGYGYGYGYGAQRSGGFGGGGCKLDLNIFLRKTCFFAHNDNTPMRLRFFHGRKNDNFSRKSWYFSYFCLKPRSWVHVRTASLGRFKRVPTIWVLELK